MTDQWYCTNNNCACKRPPYKRKNMKQFAFVILGLFAFVLLYFGIMQLSLSGQKFYNPKQESIRRETFENSRSFIQGSIGELEQMQFEYLKLDDNKRVALKPIILKKAAEIPEKELSSDLRDFVNSLRR